MSSPGPRIAVGAIFTECNHLGGVPIDLSWFERYELYRGNAMLEIHSGVVGGMLEVLREQQAVPVPLLFASTCPGGPLTSDCYQQLKTQLLARLGRELPVAGVLLPLHGAMTVEDLADPEGDLIEAARLMVGADIPIVATLDLHAHVTRQMVRHADALVAWETYPHRDAFETGQRGARVLLDAVHGRTTPTMAMANVPVITSAINASTNGNNPFAELMRHTKSLEANPEVLSTSLFLGYPYLDVPEMGSGALVVTNGAPQLAANLAEDLAHRYWQRRHELEPVTHTPYEAVNLGQNTEGGPVLLVEAADCCGGGAAGDSVATLRVLLELAPNQRALVPVADAAAAAACTAAGVDHELTLSLGHHHDPRWGEPVEVTGRVLRLSEGKFRYTGGVWDGVEADMGPSAIFQTNEIQILITTHATYDWRDEQFQSLGVEPAGAKFVVAKNPMNYHNVYDELAKAIFILDTPGPTPATLRNVQLKNMARPYFPLDPEIENLVPAIYQ